MEEEEEEEEQQQQQHHCGIGGTGRAEKVRVQPLCVKIRAMFKKRTVGAPRVKKAASLLGQVLFFLPQSYCRICVILLIYDC